MHWLKKKVRRFGLVLLDWGLRLAGYSRGSKVYREVVKAVVPHILEREREAVRRGLYR